MRGNPLRWKKAYLTECCVLALIIWEFNEEIQGAQETDPAPNVRPDDNVYVPI